MPMLAETVFKWKLMKNKYLDFGDGVISELKEEFRTINGKIDILGINRVLKRFYLIEVKMGKIHLPALEQTLNYLWQFEQSLNHSPEYKDYEVQCYLVGKSCGPTYTMRHLFPKVKFVDRASLMTDATHGLIEWESSKEHIRLNGVNLWRPTH
ncbi:MAG: hypothetical protein UX75_C0036G0035 [Candidatus Moranbacteria bacterium GW2011_GWE2_47_10]|nr:MAG: hypothetical protein UX75_C0036G0035 [Candidatus Moranbacteria bacterium GW2011_GWE2_47_10]